MNYLHLNNKPVEKGILGPVVRRANIKIILAAGTSTYQIEQKSKVERAYMVGIWATLPGAQVDATRTNAAGSIFNSAYLVLMVRSDEQSEKIPFEQIRLANAQGKPYYLNMKDAVNLSESSVEIPDNSGIAANTVLEFQIDFCYPG